MNEPRKPHPNADVIMAWARGLDIQYREVQCGWKDWHNDGYNKPTPPFNDTGIDWRVKPKMANINGFEFPAPVTRLPVTGTEYFFASHDISVSQVHSAKWKDCMLDRRLLKQRRIHLTYEAAEEHGRAEILAVGGKV